MPTYLALVSSERLCPRDRSTPKRAQHPYPLGRPGPVTLTTAPLTRQAVIGEAGPRLTNTRTRSARVAWTPSRQRPGWTGPVKRGAVESDARCASEQDGPQGNPGRGTKPARRPRPCGKRWCQTGKEGGTDSHIRARSAVQKMNPNSPTRIMAATGSHLKMPPGPGSHCDGPEACSPREVRARSLDGRGRGKSTIAKYGSEHSLRVGHHVQGPGTEASAAAAR
jgi:hypothetical protein